MIKIPNQCLMENLHRLWDNSIVSMIHTLEYELHHFYEIFSRFCIIFQSFQWDNLLFDQQRANSQVELNQTINKYLLIPLLIDILRHLLEDRSISSSLLLKQQSFLPNFIDLISIGLDSSFVSNLILLVLKVINFDFSSQLVHTHA